MTEEEAPVTLETLAEEIREYMNCEHDWQLGEETSGWLRDREYQRCVNCRAVRLRRENRT